MRRLMISLAVVVLASFPSLPLRGSVLLLHRDALRERPAVGTATTPTLTVPAETLIGARVLTGLHTMVNHVNDPIVAEIVKPVYVNGHLALPAGTMFDGHITKIRAARRMRRAGKISFRFDHITLPTGQQVPVSAVIASLSNVKNLKAQLDSEGQLKGRHKKLWKSFLTGFLTVGSLTAARVAVASSAALSVAAPASAAAFVGYEVFFVRGGNVNVPPNTPCRIRLNSSLTVQALT